MNSFYLLFNRLFYNFPNVQNYLLSSLVMFTIIMIFILVKDNNQYSGMYLSHTELGRSLTPNSMSLVSAKFACKTSCMLGGIYLFYTWSSIDVDYGDITLNDTVERISLSIVALVPFFFLLYDFLGVYQYLPFVLVIVYLVQFVGYTTALLGLAHKVYPISFNFYRFQTMILIIGGTTIISAMNFGKSVNDWANIIFFILYGLFIIPFSYLIYISLFSTESFKLGFRTVISHGNYSSTYIVCYIFIMTFILMNGLSVLGNWTRFGPMLRDTLLYVNLLFTIPVFLLPRRKIERSYLLVDDSGPCRRIVEGVIREAHGEDIKVHIDQCDNGKCAVAKVEVMLNQGLEYDIIFMDNYMTLSLGEDAILSIRELGYMGLIVGLTSDIALRNIDAFMTVGADCVISKIPNEIQIQSILSITPRPRRTSLIRD